MTVFYDLGRSSNGAHQPHAQAVSGIGHVLVAELETLQSNLRLAPRRCRCHATHRPAMARGPRLRRGASGGGNSTQSTGPDLELQSSKRSRAPTKPSSRGQTNASRSSKIVSTCASSRRAVLGDNLRIRHGQPSARLEAIRGRACHRAADGGRWSCEVYLGRLAPGIGGPPAATDLRLRPVGPQAHPHPGTVSLDLVRSEGPRPVRSG